MLAKSHLIAICEKWVQHHQHTRAFALSTNLLINQKLRQERGLPLNPNSAGPLTDGADFSYVDGRITPLGQGQRKRMLRNEEAKIEIIALSKEIDFAIERYKQLQLAENKVKQSILERKLKPKGVALLEQG